MCFTCGEPNIFHYSLSSVFCLTFCKPSYNLITFMLCLYSSRVLITDADGDIGDVMTYYSSLGRLGAHLPLNFGLVNFPNTGICNAKCIQERVDAWVTNMPTNNTATWMVNPMMITDGNQYMHSLCTY